MSARRKPESWFKTKELAFDRDGRRCVYCGTSEGPFEGDHKTPVSCGGSWDLDNVATACVPCNQAKGDMTVEEFFSWRGQE